MEGHWLTSYLQSKREEELAEKHNPRKEYDLFQSEFSRWEMGEGRKCAQLEAVIRGSFPPIPPALHSLVEYSIPYDSLNSPLHPNTDHVLRQHTEAGFAKTTVTPIEISASLLDAPHAHLIYPHVHINDVVIGVVCNVSSSGWSIQVKRICNPKLNDIWNLSIAAFCPTSNTFEDSLAPVMKRRPRNGDYIKAGVVRVPRSDKEPLEVSCRKTQLLQSWSNRFHVLGLSNEDSLYRDVVTNDYGSIEAEIRADASFENPSSLLAMSSLLGLSDNLSLNSGPVLDREEYADRLRGQQEAIWAEDISRSGFRHFARSEYDRASDLFSQSLTLNPNCINAQLGKAMVYGCRLDFVKAINFIQLVLSASIPQEILDRYHPQLQPPSPPRRGRSNRQNVSSTPPPPRNLSQEDESTIRRNKDVMTAVAVLQRLNTRHLAAHKRDLPIDAIFRPLLLLPHAPSPFSPTKNSSSTSSTSAADLTSPSSDPWEERPPSLHAQHSDRDRYERDQRDGRRDGRDGRDQRDGRDGRDQRDHQRDSIDQRDNRRRDDRDVRDDRGDRGYGEDRDSSRHGDSRRDDRSEHQHPHRHHQQASQHVQHKSRPHSPSSGASTSKMDRSGNQPPASSYGRTRDFYERKDDRREDRFDRGRYRGGEGERNSNDRSSSYSNDSRSNNRRDDNNSRRGDDRHDMDGRRDAGRRDSQQVDYRDSSHHHHSRHYSDGDGNRGYERDSRDSRDSRGRNDQQHSHHHAQQHSQHQRHDSRSNRDSRDRSWSSVVTASGGGAGGVEGTSISPAPFSGPSTTNTSSTASTTRGKPFDQAPQALSANLSLKKKGGIISPATLLSSPSAPPQHTNDTNSPYGTMAGITSKGTTPGVNSSSTSLHSMIIDPGLDLLPLPKAPSALVSGLEHHAARSSTVNSTSLSQPSHATSQPQQQQQQRTHAQQNHQRPQQYQRKRTREPSPETLVPNKVPRNGHSTSPYA